MCTPEYYEYIYCKHNGIYMLILWQTLCCIFKNKNHDFDLEKTYFGSVYKYNIAFFSLSCVPTTAFDLSIYWSF